MDGVLDHFPWRMASSRWFTHGADLVVAVADLRAEHGDDTGFVADWVGRRHDKGLAKVNWTDTSSMLGPYEFEAHWPRSESSPPAIRGRQSAVYTALLIL
jgi:hypothetical protein